MRRVGRGQSKARFEMSYYIRGPSPMQNVALNDDGLQVIFNDLPHSDLARCSSVNSHFSRLSSIVLYATVTLHPPRRAPGVLNLQERDPISARPHLPRTLRDPYHTARACPATKSILFFDASAKCSPRLCVGDQR